MDVLPATQAIQLSIKRTRDLFGSDFGQLASAESDIGTSYKRKAEYDHVRDLPKALAEKQAKAIAAGRIKRPKVQNTQENQMALVKSGSRSSAQHGTSPSLPALYEDRTCNNLDQNGMHRGS